MRIFRQWNIFELLDKFRFTWDLPPVNFVYNWINRTCRVATMRQALWYISALQKILLEVTYRLWQWSVWQMIMLVSECQLATIGRNAQLIVAEEHKMAIHETDQTSKSYRWCGTILCESAANQTKSTPINTTNNKSQHGCWNLTLDCELYRPCWIVGLWRFGGAGVPVLLKAVDQWGTYWSKMENSMVWVWYGSTKSKRLCVCELRDKLRQATRLKAQGGFGF
jgi:hypothetical protein